MKRMFIFFIFSFLLLSFNAVLHASIIGVTGDGQIISAPSSVADDSPGAENTIQQGFDEVQGYTLTSALGVDGGSLAAGLTVDSHMIFLNTYGSTYADGTATWTFSGNILGVMADRPGSLEVASSSFLGAPGTFYPGTSFDARGLEGNPLVGVENDWYAFSGNTLRLYMQVTEPGDWIRVVTASNPVPEPATMVLFGIGLLGLAGVSRKKR